MIATIADRYRQPEPPGPGGPSILFCGSLVPTASGLPAEVLRDAQRLATAREDIRDRLGAEDAIRHPAGWIARVVRDIARAHAAGPGATAARRARDEADVGRYLEFSATLAKVPVRALLDALLIGAVFGPSGQWLDLTIDSTALAGAAPLRLEETQRLVFLIAGHPAHWGSEASKVCQTCEGLASDDESAALAALAAGRKEVKALYAACVRAGLAPAWRREWIEGVSAATAQPGGASPYAAAGSLIGVVLDDPDLF